MVQSSELAFIRRQLQGQRSRHETAEAHVLTETSSTEGRTNRVAKTELESENSMSAVHGPRVFRFTGP